MRCSVCHRDSVAPSLLGVVAEEETCRAGYDGADISDSFYRPVALVRLGFCNACRRRAAAKPLLKKSLSVAVSGLLTAGIWGGTVWLRATGQITFGSLFAFFTIGLLPGFIFLATFRELCRLRADSTLSAAQGYMAAALKQGFLPKEDVLWPKIDDDIPLQLVIRRQNGGVTRTQLNVVSEAELRETTPDKKAISRTAQWVTENNAVVSLAQWLREWEEQGGRLDA